MDPITIALLALAGAMASDSSSASSLARVAAHGEDVPLDEFYPGTARGTMTIHASAGAYEGDNVIWDGTPGQMVRVDPAYMQAIDGNIFDDEKLRAVARAVSQADEPLVFTVPYGMMTKIGLGQIKESIEYATEEPDEVPYTTGDDDLDEFLANPRQAMWPWEIGEHDEDAVFVSELEAYYDESGLERLADFKRELEQAERDEEGDFGQWASQIRDGNHRAFGAVLGGEPFVWMLLSSNQFQDVREAQAKHALGEALSPWEMEDLELGEMLF